jgi:putative PIN family toxin of toxin-antitoxin system
VKNSVENDLRAVIDTSVWVSALINPAGFPARILTAFLDRRFTLLVCDPLLHEIAAALSKPRIVRKYGIKLDSVTRLLNVFQEHAVNVQISGSIQVCRDPKDNFIIETAILGRADMLVSRDDDLKGDEQLVRFLEAQGITAMSVQRFLDALDTNSL